VTAVVAAATMVRSIVTVTGSVVTVIVGSIVFVIIAVPIRTLIAAIAAIGARPHATLRSPPPAGAAAAIRAIVAVAGPPVVMPPMIGAMPFITVLTILTAGLIHATRIATVVSHAAVTAAVVGCSPAVTTTAVIG
jgi:hypothetical protein